TRRGLLRRMLDAVRPAGGHTERVEDQEPEPPAPEVGGTGAAPSPRRIAARAVLEVPPPTGGAPPSPDAPGSEADEPPAVPEATEPTGGASSAAPDVPQTSAAVDVTETPATLARTPAPEVSDALPEERPPAVPDEPRDAAPRTVMRLARRVLSRSRSPQAPGAPPADPPDAGSGRSPTGAHTDSTPPERASRASAGPEARGHRAGAQRTSSTVEAPRAPGVGVVRPTAPTPTVRRTASRSPATPPPSPAPGEVRAAAEPEPPAIWPADAPGAPHV